MRIELTLANLAAEVGARRAPARRPVPCVVAALILRKSPSPRRAPNPFNLSQGATMASIGLRKVCKRFGATEGDSGSREYPCVTCYSTRAHYPTPRRSSWPTAGRYWPLPQPH